MAARFLATCAAARAGMEGVSCSDLLVPGFDHQGISLVPTVTPTQIARTVTDAPQASGAFEGLGNAGNITRGGIRSVGLGHRSTTIEITGFHSGPVIKIKDGTVFITEVTVPASE